MFPAQAIANPEPEHRPSPMALSHSPKAPVTASYLSGLQLPLILIPFILQFFHLDFEVPELLQ